jgi:hypothetical protein
VPSKNSVVGVWWECGGECEESAREDGNGKIQAAGIGKCMQRRARGIGLQRHARGIGMQRRGGKRKRTSARRRAEAFAF